MVALRAIGRSKSLYVGSAAELRSPYSAAESFLLKEAPVIVV